MVHSSVTDFAAFVEYKFEERDFQPLESVGHHEVPLSPKESSNKNVVVGQLQMQKAQRALDEKVIQAGISLTDLELDLLEGQDSSSDLEKEENQELLDDIFTDLSNEFKP